MEYKKIIQQQHEYLNQIDFRPYLIMYDCLKDIWSKMQAEYEGTDKDKVFNQITYIEFLKYLEQRYNVFQEVRHWKTK